MPDDVAVADALNHPLSLETYSANGCAELGQILDSAACANLRKQIDRQRPVNADIFYATAAEFEEHGRWVNYAPGRTDHNLLVNGDFDLGFIEENEEFQASLTALCGRDYDIFKKSIIRSMAPWAVPEWIRDEISDVGRPNMNPYIRDEFQDVQYFLYTDFHQDKTRPDSDFVTVYVYLDDVDPEYSALQILVGSHRLGMTTYPHSLRRSSEDEGRWFYNDTLGNHARCPLRKVISAAGSVSVFHCLTLHGTGYNKSRNPRISLRYLVRPDPHSDGAHLHQAANSKIIGAMRVAPHRVDVGPDGRFLKTGASIRL